MMKIFMILIGLVFCGCVSQPAELTQEESSLDVYYEEPNTAYENLGRIVATSRNDMAKDTLGKILSRAVELGADGIIIHFSGNRNIARGTAAGKVYQIEATALRYVN
jgi:hypothetical protein